MAGRRRHIERNFERGELTGMSTFRTLEALREMGEHVVNNAKAALAEGVELVVADAKSRCPVKTGKLRDSTKATPKQGGAVYVLSANARDDNGIAYGQFVEWSPKINRPFLYPAMDDNYDIVVDKIKNAIKDAIDRGH